LHNLTLEFCFRTAAEYKSLSASPPTSRSVDSDTRPILMMKGADVGPFDVATFVSELSSSHIAGFPAPASVADVHEHFASSHIAVSAHPPSSDTDILSRLSTSKIPPRVPTPVLSAAASTSASPVPSQNANQFPITQSYYRRPGQGVSIKDGVSVPRRNVGAANAKQG
jgi:hypothetical protein